jgi:hypothetical protein
VKLIGCRLLPEGVKKYLLSGSNLSGMNWDGVCHYSGLCCSPNMFTVIGLSVMILTPFISMGSVTVIPVEKITEGEILIVSFKHYPRYLNSSIFS